jgi:hypothetical protein
MNNLAVIKNPLENGTLFVRSTSVKKINSLNQFYNEPYSKKIKFLFRDCEIGETTEYYGSSQNLKVCTLCPLGKYSLEKPILIFDEKS